MCYGLAIPCILHGRGVGETAWIGSLELSGHVDIEGEFVLMAVATAMGAVVEMDVCGRPSIRIVLPHDHGTDAIEITALKGENINFRQFIGTEEERAFAFAVAEGGNGGVFRLADAVKGPFVVAVHVAELHDIAIVDGGESEFGRDVVERRVEE